MKSTIYRAPIMRVLVTFAVDAEFAPWRRLRKLREIEIGGVKVSQAEVGRAAVDFVVTGMGMENASRVTDVVMAQPYSICIASGFCGALKPEFPLGAVLAAEAVQQLGKSKTIQCAPRLVRAARSPESYKSKMFLTTEEVIRTPEEKAKLAPFADAVDMESFAILSAAEKHKVAAVAIRVISDTASGEIPGFLDGMIDDRGRVKPMELIRRVVRQPNRLPKLVRLGRDSKTASEALAHFLEGYIRQLSLLTPGEVPLELSEVAAR